MGVFVSNVELPLNGLVDFVSMNRDFARHFDSQANLVAANFNDRNHDVLADRDALAFRTTNYKHGYLPMEPRWLTRLLFCQPELLPICVIKASI